MKAAMTARELRQRVAAKFGRENRWDSGVVLPEHVVLFEVPFMGRLGKHERQARQRIDVVAIGLWSRTDGLVHGFEVKVSRGDLLAELKDLSKSELAADACDRWWLVLASGIRHDDDPIPSSWGILEARGRGLTVIRNAEPQPGNSSRLIAGVASRALAAPRYGRALAERRGFEYGREVGARYGARR